MGQKTNPNIFRLGVNKNEWNSKYYEKNKEESTLYTYQNIQIQSYLKQFLKNNGLIFHNCNLHFNGTNLYVFVSYYKTKKSLFLIDKSTPTQNIKLNSVKRGVSNKNYKKIDETNILKTNQFFDETKHQNNRRRRKKVAKTKIKRLQILKQYKKKIAGKKKNNNETLKANFFMEQLLESLSIFTGKKYHIFLTLQNLNKGVSLRLSSPEQVFLKKKVLSFRRYSRNKFFRESLNIILILAKIKNSARIFSYFLAGQLSTQKRHNYFLIFLKRILPIFVESKFFNIEGVKIIINGRFNGAPRSKSRLLLIGEVPIQQITKQIDYHQTTSYTKNGTFGIKVWVNQN